MTVTDLLPLVTPQLRQAANRMWTAEPATRTYHRWLLVSHDLLRATADLLATAAAECVRRDDPLSAVLSGYFAENLRGEYGHERWLVEDFAAAGGDPRTLEARVPAPAAARLAGAQYYWIRHQHPVALVAHIALLELYPPAPEVVPYLMARTGLPATAFRTIRRHVELDAGHADELQRLLARLPLTDRHRALLRTSLLTSADGLVDVMHEITEGSCTPCPTRPASTNSASTPATSPRSSAR